MSTDHLRTVARKALAQQYHEKLQKQRTQLKEAVQKVRPEYIDFLGMFSQQKLREELSLVMAEPQPSKALEKRLSWLLDLIVPARDRAMVCYYADHMRDYPYSNSLDRRPFRTKNTTAYTDKLWQLLTRYLSVKLLTYDIPLEKILRREMPEEVLAYLEENPWSGCGCGYSPWQIAYALDTGNASVEDAVTKILTEENHSSMLSHALIQGICLSHSTAFHRLLGKLLLAAKLQEGLRQSICECMDCGTVEAFQSLLKVIVENDLLRYSSVKRAVGTWLGFLTPETRDLDRISGKSLRLLVDCLENEGLRKECLATSDAMQIHIALWSYAVFDIQDAVNGIGELVKDGQKEQLLAAGYFAQMMELPTVSAQISKYVLKNHSHCEEILALWLPCFLPLRHLSVYEAIRNNAPIDFSLWFANKEEIREHYELIRDIASGFPQKAKTFSPCVFPWFEARVSRSDFAGILCTLAAMSQDADLIDEACSLLKDCSADHRSAYYTILLSDPRSSVQRQTAIAGIADKESSTRESAFQLVSKLSLSPEEYRSTEDFLRLKNSEIRKNVLTLLYTQEDGPLQSCIQRLLESNKEEIRLGALDLLLQLQEDPKRKHLVPHFLPRLSQRAREEAVPPKEQILLDRLLPSLQEKVPEEAPLCSPEDLYAPKDFDEGYLALCLETFTAYFPDSQLPKLIQKAENTRDLKSLYSFSLSGILPSKTALMAAADLLSLSKWIDEHRTASFTTHTGDTALLGNVHPYGLTKKDMQLHLWELWQEWYEKNGLDPQRILRAALLYHGYLSKTKETEAIVPLLREVFGTGYVYTKKLPYHEIIKVVLECFLQDIPTEDRRRLAYALGLWYLRCVPEDRSILPLPSDIYITGEVRFIPLLNQNQLRLIYEGLKCQRDESLPRLFPLAVAVEQRMQELRKNYPEVPKERGVYFVSRRNPYDELDFAISKLSYADAKAYLYAGYAGVLSKAQLYAYILSPNKLKDALTLITSVSSAHYERGRSVSSHNIYRNHFTARTVTDFLGKETAPTEEDEALISFVTELYDALIPLLLSTELRRGDSSTAYSHAMGSIVRIYGAEYFTRILHAMGKDSPDRSACRYWNSPFDRRGVLSYLLSVCIPKEEDSVQSLALALQGKEITEKRLIEAALYSPEWIPLVGEYLKLEGFTSACYYFMAHMKEDFDDKRVAMIAQYTPLSTEELNLGAFDIQWFRRAYEEIGEKHFNLIYDAAKYSTDGAKHTRARKYADAVLGRLDPSDCKDAIKSKRNKDLLMAYALLPLADEEDLCKRYLLIHAFRKESKAFGSQRSASESKAADMALRNLATNGGYSDPLHLTLRMEAKIIEDQRALLEEQMIEGVSCSITIDATGRATLEVSKDGKALKSPPAKLKKHETVIALTAMVKTLTEQYRRTKQLLEQAMEDRSPFLLKDLILLSTHPVVAPMLRNLVLISDQAHGFLSEGGLVDASGVFHPLCADTALTIAHPVDLYERNCWRAYQKYLFDREIKQVFRQVFRELYLKTPEEAELFHSLRYAGNQILPAKTVSTLKTRRWVADVETGLQKVYYKENIVAHIYALADWYSPGEIEAPTLEWVCFSHRLSGEELRIKDVPDVIFSEVMRDVDLAVSVAHAGGVDPEAGHSTIEMRAAILDYLLPMFRLDNVRVENRHALIRGKLGEYSVHLGSGVVHQLGGSMIPVLPVHSQHRGRIFLPFVDEDPKTAEILSKILLFAEDQKIKDPSILSAIQKNP